MEKKIDLGWMIAWGLMILIINFMLWIGGAAYGEFRVPVFVALVGAQVLGAMLFGLFLQGWKR